MGGHEKTERALEELADALMEGLLTGKIERPGLTIDWTDSEPCQCGARLPCLSPLITCHHPMRRR